MNNLPPKTSLTTTTDPTSAESVYELMSALKVSSARWHMLAATDGSGTTGAPTGYGAILISRSPYSVQTLAGSCTSGTNNDAEVNAVMLVVSHALRNRPVAFTEAYYIHLLTDSSYVAGTLDKIKKGQAVRTKMHQHLWKGIAEAKRHGILITAHHMPRNSTPLMIAVDILSKAARRSAISLAGSKVHDACINAVTSSFPLTKAETVDGQS